jgi:membrane fusion protein (multidrug efflux system)
VVGHDNKVMRKDVEMNASAGNDWIITKGLAEGDQVIVTGVQSAHEGGQVTTTAWQPPAQATVAASASQPASSAAQ